MFVHNLCDISDTTGLQISCSRKFWDLGRIIVYYSLLHLDGYSLFKSGCFWWYTESKLFVKKVRKYYENDVFWKEDNVVDINVLNE